MSDYRWQVLEDARPAIANAFHDDGVVRVEVVAAFPDQSRFGVWLGTRTDADAQRLRTWPSTSERVRELLAAGGFRESDLGGLGVVVQSQESVDREYGGSWFNALR